MHRLGVIDAVQRKLRITKPIDSLNGLFARRCRNIKRIRRDFPSPETVSRHQD